ncbi:MAG: TniQ family protein [Alkalilacustris sp.]
MPAPLPLRVAPVPRETWTSLLSRMAALNGTDVTMFASDMGGSAKRFTGYGLEDVRFLVEAAGLDDAAVAALRSWTGHRVGDGRTQFRGEVFITRAVRSRHVRGCPICLREDAEAWGGDPLAAMALRGDWQFREVSVCVRHGHPLARLWEVEQAHLARDVGHHLRPVSLQIVVGGLDRPRLEPNPFDLWLDRRLEDGRDDTWLAQLSTFAAATTCRLFGQELLRQENGATDTADEAPRRAQAAGFAVASSGQAAIRSALDRLAAAATGHKETAGKAFRDLYAKLAWEYAGEADFDPFRRILRDCILDTWPIAPGTEVLGEVLEERRLHSVSTATAEIGTQRNLAAILEDRGVLQKDDPRPASRRVFDARRHAPLLAEIAALVGPQALCAALGASRSELKALIADGVLTPFIGAPCIKERWRLSDAQALLSVLQAAAVPVAAGAPGWQRLVLMRQHTGVGMDRMISGIREASLSAGCSSAQAGFTGILVRWDEVERLASDHVSASVGIPAGTFGRSIGLRDNGLFLTFISAGHTPATRWRHPVKRNERFYMTEADIAAFHARYVTLPVLERECGTHRDTLRARLATAGVRPFSDAGQSFSPIYLRKNVEAVVK